MTPLSFEDAKRLMSAVRKALPTDRPVDVYLHADLYGEGPNDKMNISLVGRAPVLRMEVKVKGQRQVFVGHPEQSEEPA